MKVLKKKKKRTKISTRFCLYITQIMAFVIRFITWIDLRILLELLRCSIRYQISEVQTDKNDKLIGLSKKDLKAAIIGNMKEKNLSNYLLLF